MFLIHHAKYQKNQCFCKIAILTNFQFLLHFLFPAQYYDIYKMSRIILVGRDGKVLSIDVRKVRGLDGIMEAMFQDPSNPADQLPSTYPPRVYP